MLFSKHKCINLFVIIWLHVAIYRYYFHISALELLNVPLVQEEVNLFLDDGSQILCDEDLKDVEITGGKLLIVATSFEDYQRMKTDGTGS